MPLRMLLTGSALHCSACGCASLAVSVGILSGNRYPAGSRPIGSLIPSSPQCPTRMLVEGKTGRNGKIGSFAASTAIFLCFFFGDDSSSLSRPRRLSDWSLIECYAAMLIESSVSRMRRTTSGSTCSYDPDGEALTPPKLRHEAEVEISIRAENAVMWTCVQRVASTSCRTL